MTPALIPIGALLGFLVMVVFLLFVGALLTEFCCAFSEEEEPVGRSE